MKVAKGEALPAGSPSLCVVRGFRFTWTGCLHRKLPKNGITCLAV
jgi:hypothetical protein